MFVIFFYALLEFLKKSVLSHYFCQVEPRKETFIVANAVGGKIYQQNRFGVDSTEIPFVGLSRPVAIDYDPVDDKVYIADAGRNVIMRGNLDGSGQEIIITSFVTGI